MSVQDKMPFRAPLTTILQHACTGLARNKGWLSATGRTRTVGSACLEKITIGALPLSSNSSIVTVITQPRLQPDTLRRGGQLPPLRLSTPISHGGRSDVRLGKGRCGRANFLPELVAAGSRLGGIEQQAGSMEGPRQSLHRSCELVSG